MAIDPNIVLRAGAGVPPILQAIAGGMELGKSIRRSPLEEALMRQRLETAQAQLQSQQSQLSRDRFIGTPQRVVRDGQNFLVGLTQDPYGQVSLSETPVSGQFVSGLGETADQQLAREIEEKTKLAEIELKKQQALTPIEAEQVRQAEQARLGAQIDAAANKRFSEQLGSEGAKIYSDLQKSAQQASAFIPRLQSLRDLASRVDTGTGAEIKLAAKKALGIDSADMEELNAKLGELAQDILNQQTGTKTDFDFQNAVRQSAALGKTKEANIRLINALINRQIEAVNFGDQAREAFQQGGVKGVLDMRFNPESEGVNSGVQPVSIFSQRLNREISEQDILDTLKANQGMTRDQLMQMLQVK